jgi:hypothetical protein
MILIPELQKIIILVPRTGSGSLRRAIAAKYPQSVLLYRHMEADGVPQGYDRWEKLGVIRDPLDRLWSLYKFLRNFNGPHADPAYSEAMRTSVKQPFSEWLMNNQTVFTHAYDATGKGRFFPKFTVRHPLPENRKSQFIYLRPDLGTTIWPFQYLQNLAEHLNVNLTQHNNTPQKPPPPLTDEASQYMQHWFQWDYARSAA